MHIGFSSTKYYLSHYSFYILHINYIEYAEDDLAKERD
jgi:hypothetical protein